MLSAEYHSTILTSIVRGFFFFKKKKEKSHRIGKLVME